MIHIQTAAPHHFCAIAELNIEAYREYASDLLPEAWTAMQANLLAIASVAQRAVFLVALIEEELAGSVAYGSPGNSREPIPSAWASILLLAVSPRYRRRGIARALMQVCIQRAQDEQAQTIGLFTSEGMTTAHQLYQSLGFCLDSEIPQRHGRRYWRYRLDLSS